MLGIQNILKESKKKNLNGFFLSWRHSRFKYLFLHLKFESLWQYDFTRLGIKKFIINPVCFVSHSSGGQSNTLYFALV